MNRLLLTLLLFLTFIGTQPVGAQPAPVGSIQGYKFHDLNADGARDPGEPPMDDVVFELWQWVPANPNPVLVPAVDAAAMPVAPQLTVGGVFTVVNLLEADYVVRERLDLTDTNGDGILDAGDFVGTEFVDQGLRASTPTEYSLSLSAGENATPDPASHPGLEFGNYYTASIQGYKFLDLDADGTDDGGTDPRLPGVTITLSGGSSQVVVTDATGEYAFVQLDPGTYTVTETPPPGTTPSTPVSTTFSLSSGEKAVAEAGQAGAIPSFNVEVLEPSLAFGNYSGSISGVPIPSLSGWGVTIAIVIFFVISLLALRRKRLIGN